METVKRRSPRQAAILRVIWEADIHPTAEWVFQRVREEFPQVSLATVYRNIGQLLDQGELATVGVVNGQERFDGNTKPHTHFICRQCGAVLDLPAQPHDPSLDQVAQAAMGGIVQGHQLTFYGSCRDCAQAAEREKQAI